MANRHRNWTIAALLAMTMVALGAGNLRAADAPTAAGAPATAAAPSTAPAPQRFTSASGSQVLVTGTSTLHDWTVKGAAAEGEAVVSGRGPNVDAASVRIDSIHLSIPVKTLKSTEGSGMDDTMYGALDLKHHPNIEYRLTKATPNGPAGAGGAQHFDAVGDLTIAGATRSITLDVVVQPRGKNGLTVSSSTPLKMTDFKIKPPTAMLGMVKSGDGVNVKVTWQLDEPK